MTSSDDDDLLSLSHLPADCKVLYINGSTVVIGNSSGQELACSTGSGGIALSKTETEILRIFNHLDIRSQVDFMTRMFAIEADFDASHAVR